MKFALKTVGLEYNNILKNINVSIEENKITAIIGESGSGKTTLLKSISGLLKYKGDIQNILGEKISAYYEDNVLLFSDVYTNLFSVLKPSGLSNNTIKKRIHESLKMVNLENIIYKNICDLSYIEKKLVKLIQVLIQKHKIILLDNPFDGLPYKYVEALFKVLKELKNTTIIYTATNFDHILCPDNVIIIKDGDIVKCDKFKNIFDDESALLKSNLNLPFEIELSNKLKFYNLVNTTITDSNRLVDAIWK